MPGTRHYYFLDSIGCGDWCFGTMLQDVRYAVEGYDCFDGAANEASLPEQVVLHFPACGGGDVVEGYAIYNYVRDLAARGVKTQARVEGLCASIAVLCALACDEVVMADAALWMVHKPTSDGWNLNADDMRAAADILDKIQNQLVSRYVARTGMSAETAHELLNKTSWLTADECLALGFITSKVPETPLVAPVGSAGVLNFFPASSPTPPLNMAISPAEKKSIVDGVIAGVKNFFAAPPAPTNRTPQPAKAKNEATPASEVVPKNATSYAVDITGGMTMYTDISDDGLEDLEVGDLVSCHEDLSVPYPDGDYTTSAGQALTVLAGAIDEIEDASMSNQAEAPAAAAQNAALVAEVEKLRADNALLTRQKAALKNKVRNTVPGSAGNPTAPGQVQVIPTKNSVSAPAAPAAFTIRKH